MWTRRGTLQFAATAVGSLAATTTGLRAQGYPNRPIKLIVPFSPGGSTDIIGRLLARDSQKYIGTATVVENKPGARRDDRP